MAHFAELDKENKVLRVVVIDNYDVNNNGGDQSATAAEAVKSIVPFEEGGVKWVQTSYNHNFRRRYAGLGMTYNESMDMFLHPKPGADWILDANGDWQPPIPIPNENKIYRWDEDAYQADNTQGWILLPNQPD